MRWLRRGPERTFHVDMTVHQLDSIPVTHRLLFVYWRVPSARLDGYTPSAPVGSGNAVRWEQKVSFTLRIAADPASPVTLLPALLTLQLRSERRARWVGAASFTPEGKVDIDLAEVAAVGAVSRNFLVQQSLLNTTLKISIRMRQVAGDRIFRTRAVAPSPQEPSTPGASSDSVALSEGAASAASAPGVFMVSEGARSALLADEKEQAAPGRALSSGESGASVRPLRSFDSAQLGRSSSGLTANLLGSSTASGLDPLTSTAFPGAPSEHGKPVLEYSIPDPAAVQKQVYERMFQERIRDSWPRHIVDSRENAAALVDKVYFRSCAEHGIGASSTSVATASSSTLASSQDQRNLSVEVLLESRNAAHPSSAVPTRRLSSGGALRSLPGRSSSMSELRGAGM